MSPMFTSLAGRLLSRERSIFANSWTSAVGRVCLTSAPTFENKQVRDGRLRLEERARSASITTSSILLDKQKPPSLNSFESENIVSKSSYRTKRTDFKIPTTELDQKFRMEWPKITLFGDSITRRSVDPDNGCWGSMIAYKVGEYFDVDVRGFEGYNTKWALSHMEKLFPRSYLEKVEIFVEFFGHNDSWDQKIPLSIPVEDYEKNVRSMIKYLNDNGLENRKIILITPTWFHREAAQRFMASQTDLKTVIIDKNFEEAKRYSDAILKIAQDNNIDVIDFFKASHEFEDLESMFCDGIHFSKVGARMLYNLLMPVIEKKLEASFKKPLGNLWHLQPYDQVPEVLKNIELLMRSEANNQ